LRVDTPAKNASVRAPLPAHHFIAEPARSAVFLENKVRRD